MNRYLIDGVNVLNWYVAIDPYIKANLSIHFMTTWQDATAQVTKLKALAELPSALG